MRAEHNIDIHGGGHTLVGNTITIFLHYLQTSAFACAVHLWVTEVCPELECNLKRPLVKWKKSKYMQFMKVPTSVQFFVLRLLPGLFYRVKASISTFYPLLTFPLEIWVKVTKNRRIFFPPTKGVPIIIESSTDKSNRKKSERFKFAT